MTAPWSRNPAVVESSAGGRSVLFNPDRELTLVLNPIGSLVWALLETPAPVSVLVDIISEHVESVSKDQIRQDVEQFVLQLAERDMLLAT